MGEYICKAGLDYFNGLLDSHKKITVTRSETEGKCYWCRRTTFLKVVNTTK